MIPGWTCKPCATSAYWEALRKVYGPFDVAAAGPSAPTGRVYTHEIPGGQLSNLRQQAIALGFGDRFEEVESNYAAADRMLGRLIKVTPSSKVVGDLALALLGAGIGAEEFAADPDRYDIPESVIGFLRGELGDPAGGWPEPLARKAYTPQRGPPHDELSNEDRRYWRNRAAAPAALNRLLFPGPTKEFETHPIPMATPARSVPIGLLRVGSGSIEHRVRLGEGCRTADRAGSGIQTLTNGDASAMCTMNGQLRPILVRDRSIASAVHRGKSRPHQPRPRSRTIRGVVTVTVSEGDTVETGRNDPTIEAMKMEAAITAPKAGTVARVAVTATAQVDGGDLLVELA